MDTQSPSQFNESDNDDVLLEAENNVQAEDRSQHNYTSFIPVPQQQQTEIEAIRNILQHDNTPLTWPELSKTPVSEFTTEGLATMAFPTLFPYGIGDPTKKQRHHAVSLTDAFKHLVSFGEIVNNKIVWRFASHPRFMYWALNMKQRHQVLSQANVYMKQYSNDAALTLEQLKVMVNRADSELLISRFSRYISNVQGTKQYWYQRSLELRALIESKGTPTFFWTVSAADTYWPELHNLMPHDPNPTHYKKIQAVINNPHLADWYFTQRLSDLIKNWLYKAMDAEWHWYRFEYQSRGSTHAHGCAKLKSDPGLCDLMKKAAIAWKLQKETQSSVTLSTTDRKHIAEGKQAAQIVIEYCNWLITTFNKDLPSDNWRMPTPEHHPSAKNPLTAQSHEHDYCELVNTVERHTKCSAAYCLKKKQGQTEVKCRFDYPRQLQSETTLQFEELSNHRVRAKIITKRNDPLIVTHNESLLKYWRANVDVQAIVDIEDCVRYMTMQVCSKSRNHITNSQTNISQLYKQSFPHISNKQCYQISNDQVNRRKRLQSTRNSTYAIVQLYIHICNISNRRHQDIANSVQQYTDHIIHKLSMVEAYAKRACMIPNNKAITDMNLLQFAEKFYLYNNILKERKNSIVIRTYPNYSSNSTGKNYPLHCKYQLIKYKPWKEQFSDAWDNQCDNDETYLKAYHEFINTAAASKYIHDIAHELEQVEQYLLLTRDEQNSDEYNVESAEWQEEWMLLSQLNPTFDESTSTDINSINWQAQITTPGPLTTEQVHESASWITAARKEILPNNTCNLQVSVTVDINTLKSKKLHLTL